MSRQRPGTGSKKLVTTRFNLDFVSRRHFTYALSGLLLLISLVSFLWQGMNFGIDFTGGNLWLLQFDQAVEAQQLEELMAATEISGTLVQRAEPQGGGEQATAFLLRTPPLNDGQRQDVEQALAQQVGPYEVLSFDEVSGTIGSEIRRNALVALTVATVGMIIYISIRFQWRFALAAVAALFHDIFIVAGIFSVFQIGVDATFVAALLTIFGYSINDTIVIFDRVRENAHAHPRLGAGELLNASVNQTLSRTINTSLTTLVAVSALYVFGGGTIRDFVLALILGFVIGTYSSVAIAGPLWLDLGGHVQREKPAAPA